MFNFALLFVLSGQILVVSVPWLQSIFQTTYLTISDWIWITLLTSVVFWIEEARKRYFQEGFVFAPLEEVV